MRPTNRVGSISERPRGRFWAARACRAHTVSLGVMTQRPVPAAMAMVLAVVIGIGWFTCDQVEAARNPAATDTADAGVRVADGREVGGSTDWRMVAAGAQHACGIRNSGRLYCWGQDRYGQLGDGGPNASKRTPVEVAGAATDWASVTVGLEHTCALKHSGRLYCWGRDDHGQLGDGGINHNQRTPSQVFGATTDWTMVNASARHTCALKSSGRLYCWGSNSYGQLGHGTPGTDEFAPVRVAGGATNWSSVDAGGYHTCGLRADGRLYCWGRDVNGQLGDGGVNANQPTPVEVAGAATDWTSVSAGDWHTCATNADRRLFCWGLDLVGALGDGAAASEQPAPVEVAGGKTDWRNVSAGGDHTCARRAGGRLFCWGDDNHGQLGNDNAHNNATEPVEVFGLDTRWRPPSAQGDDTCAPRRGGRLFCWGSDHDSQLGNGGKNVDQPVPVPVA